MSSSDFTITANDPCLDGHFPGNPIVPGVVILDRVIDAVEADGGGKASVIRRCKFVKPLLPGETCHIEWQFQDGTVRFVCSNQAGTLARGTILIANG